MARVQLRWARFAELLKDDLARGAVEFGVAEHYSPGRRSLMPDSEARPAVSAVSSMASLSIPVDPKPPAPRVVASSVSTSAKAARWTGAGTSWAMRSPRLISNGSSPRLEIGRAHV